MSFLTFKSGRYLSWIITLMLAGLACRAATEVTHLFPSNETPEVSTAPALTGTPTLPPIKGTSQFWSGIEPYLPFQNHTNPNFGIRLHPDGGLYVGDQVSIEVFASRGVNLDGQKISLQISSNDPISLGPAEFSSFGLSGRPQATFFWAWDTSLTDPGPFTMTVSILPEGPVWTQTEMLFPSSQRPAKESMAHWKNTETDCCMMYYISGTAADRDISALEDMVNTQAETVSKLLHSEFDASKDSQKPLPIVWVPRVLGHGGFANAEVSVSYLDRSYTSGMVDIIVRHEMVHLLDAQLGGELRPTLFVEGLAVYLSGGHFKPEPLLPRAAALLELNQFIPLEELVDSFYLAQHETGYLEAGALVEYFVTTYGWEAFSAFYRDIHQSKSGTQREASDDALQKHFQLSFDTLANDFLKALKHQDVKAEHLNDVRLSVAFYDTVRRYQQNYDSSAYFLSAWMLDSRELRKRGIVADYMRHPTAIENITLETILVNAGDALRAADYTRVENVLDGINSVLQQAEMDYPEPLNADPLVQEYAQIIRVLIKSGYEVQSVELNGNQAHASVTVGNNMPFQLLLSQSDLGWVLSAE